MFMLVMQFLWKYIDDLMGKGLDLTIILELLFYVSASLLPLALPLAILLSSIIVMGNLGEYNELTALKSSGLSIYRILRPLTIIIVFIAVGTFYFSNYIIPIANFKWHSIIWDIQETKLTSFLKPGAYTQDIDGFSIKISEGKNNKFQRIVIHDVRDKSALKTITADSGEFFRSENGEFLFFKLYSGQVIEELTRPSAFSIEDKSKKKKKKNNTYPGRKANFRTGTYKMNLTGFELNRTQDDLFKDDYEMLNVFQINSTVDSLQQSFKVLADNFVDNLLTKHEYFQAGSYETKEVINNTKKKKKSKNKDTRDIQKQDSIEFYTIDSITVENEEAVYEQMKSQLRTNINTLQSQLEIEANKKRNLRKFEIEFHRKFSLSFSIIILFFIGAALGAIVKKGGFGAPVVIAALLFMVYFVLISIGDNMAKEKVTSPFLGMWGPSFILTPFAIILMISAAKDRSVVDFGTIISKLKFKKK